MHKRNMAQDKRRRQVVENSFAGFPHFSQGFAQGRQGSSENEESQEMFYGYPQLSQVFHSSISQKRTFVENGR